MKIGMEYSVYAPISEYEEGKPITYGTGAFIAESVSANINYNRSDVSFYADNVDIDDDNGMTGYTIDLETAALPVEARVGLLGYKAVNGSGGGSAIDHYDVTDKATPDIGYGFIRNLKYKGEYYYETFWYRKMHFSQSSDNATTKKEQIEFGTHTLNGKGKGVKIDNSDEVKFFEYAKHDTKAAAKAWLNSRANIT